MRHIMRIGVLVLTLPILASGCASKNWVRDLLSKREAEIDQRFVRVETRLSDEAQRVDAIGTQVATLETSVRQTDEVVKTARDQADAAFTKVEALDSRLRHLWSNRHARSLVETVNVHFGFDRWDLDDNAQTALLSMVKELREGPTLSVDLQGYTDPVGTHDYNVRLSQRRVEVVRRFLVKNGVDLPRIYSVGLGPLQDRTIGDEQKRRVTVKLMVASE